VAGPLPSPDLDEEEIVADSELEFEDLENIVQNEASGDSSDDFIPEESSQSDVSQDDVPLSVTAPNTFTQPSSSKAGPSSKTLKGRRSTAKTKYETELSGSSDMEDSFATSKKAPRKNKAAPAKGKGRRGVPRRRRGRYPESDESDQESNDSGGLLESSDEDVKPPPRGLQPLETLALIKAAERRMRKKLGRKLTLVRPSIACQKSSHVDNRFFLFSRVRSRPYNSTSFTQSSRVVGEISRKPLPSSLRCRQSNPRTCGPLSYLSNKKAYIG
jgi:hypothetical protein